MNASDLADLYRRFAPLVHARARRMVGQEADDVVQEVFVRFLRAAPTRGKEASWIFKTSTNLCLDRLRHRARRDQAWQEALRTTLARDPSWSPARLAEAREMCEALIGHVDRSTQQIAMLVYLDEMTQVEVAATLGVSRKTVTKKLQRFSETAHRMMKRWQS